MVRVVQPSYIGELLYVDSKALGLTASGSELVPLDRAIDASADNSTTSPDDTVLFSRFLRAYHLMRNSRVHLYAVIPHLRLGMWTSSPSYSVEAYPRFFFMYMRDTTLHATGISVDGAVQSTNSTTEVARTWQNLSLRGAWNGLENDVVLVCLNIIARVGGGITGNVRIYHDPATSGRQLPMLLHIHLTRR